MEINGPLIIITIINYAMQYRKVQKSSWNKPYSSASSSFTKQSCIIIIFLASSF